MAEIKTKPTDASVDEYLASVEPLRRRDNGFVLKDIFERATGEVSGMWGPSLIGYGSFFYRSKSGSEGTWFATGFSPRKAAISLYGLQDDEEASALLDEVGPHRRAKGCVYVTNLDKIDLGILERVIEIAHPANMKSWVAKTPQP